MIAHLLKLVWHRKRANGLVMAEIFLSFLIVFAVSTMAVSLLSRWRAPLGYSWRDVWVMNVSAVIRQERSGLRTSGPDKEELNQTRKDAAQTERLLGEIRSFPQVEVAAADAMPPYANREWGTVLSVKGRHVSATADQATDDFARAMGIKVVRGRWFSRDDEAQSYTPIVIDTNAAQAMFGGDEPVGQKFSDDHFGDGSVRELRVVGVIAPYRQQGEFSPNGTNFVFFRASMLHPWEPFANQIVIRVRPGTPASFEAELNRRLHPESADVTFRMGKMEEMRSTAIRMRIVPVIALGIVALFLISMVTLGLTGVLWQTVTQRMREIGLRRAVGASGAAVRRQVLLEVAILATLAIAVGIVIILQLPLLGVLRAVSKGEFVFGLGTALAVIYSITILCGAYPSWMASTVDPAEALRYE